MAPPATATRGGGCRTLPPLWRALPLATPRVYLLAAAVTLTAAAAAAAVRSKPTASAPAAAAASAAAATATAAAAKAAKATPKWLSVASICLAAPDSLDDTAALHLALRPQTAQDCTVQGASGVLSGPFCVSAGKLSDRRAEPTPIEVSSRREQ